jgi:tetratricopeptide (TPR) repeat protein
VGRALQKDRIELHLRRIRLRRWDGTGDFHIDSDEPAYRASLGSNEEIDSDVVRYHYTSLTTPVTIYDYDVRTGARTLLKRDPVLGVRLAVALWPYWDARWRERQGVDYIEALLRRELDLPEDLRAWALTASAAMNGNAGEARRTVPRAVEAVAAFRAVGDERGLTEALAALGLALGNQGGLDEAERALTEGLTIARRLDDRLLIARILDRVGFIAGRRGDHARAAEINREELGTLIALGSRRGEATALRHLAVSVQHLGADEEAASLCHRALEIWKDLDDPAAIAHVQTTLADIARLGGDHDDAVQIYNTALVELQAIGDRRCTASTYKNLAMIAAERGEHRRAARLYHDGLVLRYELGDEAGLAEVLEGLACLNSADGRDEDAATLIAAAAVLRERTGSTASRHEADAANHALDTGRRRLGDDRFETSVGRGRQMSVAEIIDFALGTCSAQVEADDVGDEVRA